MSAKFAIVMAVIFLIVMDVRAFISHDDLCSVTSHHMRCGCENRQNLTVNAVLPLEITHLQVTGCGDVTVPFSAMMYLDLERLELSDIDHLHISPFAFSHVNSIKSIYLIDIAALELCSDSFTGVNNISKLAFTNVSATKIPSYSFQTVENIHEIKIFKSKFHYIDKYAFNITHVDKLEIIDSEFVFMKTEALLIMDVKKVKFYESTFYETEMTSVNIHPVAEFVVERCNFHLLESWTFNGSEVERMRFNSNNITNLKTRTFSGLVIKEKIIFQNNRIHSMEQGSLETIIPSFNSVNVTYCCNFFTCDCNLSWTWTSLEPTILNNSLCMDGEEISHLLPLFDSNRNCIALILDEKESSRTLNCSVNKLSYFATVILLSYILHKPWA